MRYLLFSVFFLITPWAFSQSRIVDSLYLALKNHPEKDTVRLAIIFDICIREYANRPEINRELAEEALEIANQIKSVKGIGTANGAIALYYWATGEYEQATIHAYKMLRVYEGIQYTHGIGQSYQMLGLIHQLQGEYEKGKDFYDKAVAIYQKENSAADLGWCYNLMGTFYMKFAQLDVASEYLLKSLKIRQKLHNELGVSQTLVNLGRISLLKNDAIGAKKYFEKSLEISLRKNHNFGMTIILISMGELYISTGEYDKAEFYLLKSVALAKSINAKKKLEETYYQLVLLEKKRGRFARALAYRELQSSYRDSLYTENKSRKIVEIEAHYESEKKEQAIKLLEQGKKIQTLWTNVLIVGALLLLIALVTIYRLQQLRSRKAKELLETQKELNEKLMDTDQLKSRFFANVSHEFRTPLSLILAPIAKKLKSPKLPKQDKDDLLLVNRNALRLLELVNQLLDMSKLEAKQMVLRIQEGNLNEFINVLVASFDALAESQNISFLKDINIATTHAWYDADKLEKIISNVLSNSFKFTPAGGSVTLYIYVAPEPDRLTMKIEDTGKGVAEEDLPYVLSPFYQSKNNTVNGQQGTGLGLALVNELVKLYQGKIKLASQVNVGTTISIDLPLNKESFSDSEIVLNPEPIFRRQQNPEVLFDEDLNEMNFRESESEEMYPDSILIVEDNPDLRNFIASIFAGNLKILRAQNGEEGFSIAVEKIPTLIVSDVMMPKMNGIELTQRLRADERTSHIPVVLLTAKADTEFRIEGLKTGADDYLAKPFSVEELEVRVHNLISQRKKLAEKFSEQLHALSNQPREQSLDGKFLLKAKTVVEANLGDEAFGVEKFADEMNLSRTQLFRKVKALLGESPTDFITNVRLKRAAELIIAKADTVTQICYMVGFNNPSYFAKRFRKKYGVVPSEYAKSAA